MWSLRHSQCRGAPHLAVLDIGIDQPAHAEGGDRIVLEEIIVDGRAEALAPRHGVEPEQMGLEQVAFRGPEPADFTMAGRCAGLSGTSQSHLL